MTIRNQNVKVNRGDAVVIFVALTAADGTPFDPSANAMMKWRVTNNAYDTEDIAVIRKDLGGGIAIVTAPIKGVNITLAESDTAELLPGLYYHELKIWDVVEPTTAMTGLVIIKRTMQMQKGVTPIPLAGNVVLSPSKPTRT